MIEFNVKIENKEGADWIRKIKSNLHKDEVLRIKFFGMLADDKEYSFVSMSLADDLKFRPNSQITPLDLIHEFSELETLPDWKKLHPNKKFIVVDFEAKVIRYTNNILTILLPDSYEENLEETTKTEKTVETEEEDNVIYLPESYKKPISTFVAIDFETIREKAIDGNIYNHLPISVGMVKVVNGKITEEFESLIKPPTNEKWENRIAQLAHGNCINAPSYDKLFEKIKNFIGNFQPVSYNCSTERGVFKDMESYYRLKHPFIHQPEDMCHMHEEEFIDPYRILRAFKEKEISLSNACARRNIRIWNAHDALSDATATAKLLLVLNSEKDKYEISSKKPKKKKTSNKSAKNLTNGFIADEYIKNKDTLFYHKKVVITGVMQSFPDRNELKDVLESFGAKINKSISGVTDIVIIGDSAGPSKMEKIEELKNEGKNIRLIFEEELHTIMNDMLN